jgi:hypothetical protein
VVTRCLRAWLDHPAYFTTTESGEQLQLTNKELIAVWAQQHGAAHEDWEIDEVLSRLRGSGVLLMGVPAATAVLRSITETVLWVAEQALQELDAK